MPTAGGTYEFRLFLDNGYIRAATSAPVVVDAGAHAATSCHVALSRAAPSRAAGVSRCSVIGSAFVPSSVVLWNGESRPTTFIRHDGDSSRDRRVGHSVDSAWRRSRCGRRRLGAGRQRRCRSRSMCRPSLYAERDDCFRRRRRHRDAHGRSRRFDRLAFDRAGRRPDVGSCQCNGPTSARA